MKTAALVTIALVTTALSILQVQAALSCSITRQGDVVVVSWLSESGKTYALSRSDQPTGNWRVLSLQTAATLPLSATLPVDGTAAFFRLIEAPANPDPEHLVWIPPGTFTMGSPENEVDRSPNEGPQTAVTLTRDYWMGKYEVTQGEYLAVMGNNPSYFAGDPSLPVEQVSWNSATDYCGQLTQRERTAGRIGANYVYRLPTEAEWEYACRAGTTTRFSYGDDPGYVQLGSYAWWGNNSGNTTHLVGQKLANPWGLYDMHGNVFEWCQDWYGAYSGGTQTDPQGPLAGDYRMIRGGDYGGWRRLARFSRSAARDYKYQSDTYFAIGFRVVLTPGQL